jgi:serine/threonine-protein kinase
MTDPTTRLNAALEGRYRIERELGEGGMATVYLADDVKHERKVALKVLKPELAAVVGGERFLAEIKTTANLQHPHILPLHDSGEADGFLYYVMPYVEGETLRSRIDREKQLPVDEAIRIGRAVAGALDYAHRNDVIHRDIKPANILLQDGQPVVADFGIALAVQEAGGGRLTETGLSLGTPYYMSPEQATADRDPGPASDIYSLGCVVYEMLTGEPPFAGGSAQVIIGKILTTSPTPVSQVRSTVPENVDAAVLRSLHKIPADRFSSASRFADALMDRGFTTAAKAVQAERPASSTPWNRLSITTTALAALLLGFTAWSQSRPAPEAPVSRYSLSFPLGEEVNPEELRPRIALAPDGGRLLYVGLNDNGVGELRIRPRDELESEVVPGTEYAITPFYSPDGSHVGYLGRSRPTAAGPGPQSVTVVSLIGGSPEQLLDSLVGLDGASWGTDGFIYFDGLTGTGTNGLMRIPEEGGDPTLVTVVDTAGGEADHIWPHVLPDANGLLFTIGRPGGPDRSDIAVLDLETGEYHAVARGVTAKYSPSGHLLYVTADGALMAAPFDADRLEVTGEGVQIAVGLSVRLSGAVDLAISRSGRLAYGTGAQATDPHELVWVDRDGRTELADDSWFANFTSVAVSPDGGRLAVSLRPELDVTGVQQVYIKDLVEGASSLLTLEGQLNYRPTWSPDGRSVVFTSDRATMPSLFSRLADGSTGAELVEMGPGPIDEATYSPDGAWLVYGMGGNIYGLRTGDDAEAVPLLASAAIEQDAAVSPDGNWLAFDSNESGRTEVYVVPFPEVGSGRRTVSNSGGFSPVWSRDGNELFYKTDAGEVVSVEVRLGDTFETGQRRTLFSFPTGERWVGVGRFDISADDQRFLLIRTRGSGESSELIVVDNFSQELSWSGR